MDGIRGGMSRLFFTIGCRRPRGQVWLGICWMMLLLLVSIYVIDKVFVTILLSNKRRIPLLLQLVILSELFIAAWWQVVQACFKHSRIGSMRLDKVALKVLIQVRRLRQVRDLLVVQITRSDDLLISCDGCGYNFKSRFCCIIFPLIWLLQLHATKTIANTLRHLYTFRVFFLLALKPFHFKIIIKIS